MTDAVPTAPHTQSGGPKPQLEDRTFRPDVEGLRAVAILLVVAFHVNIQRLQGGFVGVDVFFVISGYLITGLLIRERERTGRGSLLGFYARRTRRILPAAILVILVTLIASDLLVGHKDAVLDASDSRWTALFLANFHFDKTIPTFFSPRPTPLHAYWSLTVEEQFYLIYPALFTVLTTSLWNVSRRVRLFVGLTLVVIISFVLSITTSKVGLNTPYISLSNRAWELALGGLIALGTTQLKKLPEVVAATLTWIGIVGVLLAAVAFTATTRFPGYAAALPVGGTALVIAGGTSAPRWGVEAVLRILPFRWIGRWSYSWYLWHYPVLFDRGPTRAYLDREYARTNEHRLGAGCPRPCRSDVFPGGESGSKVSMARQPPGTGPRVRRLAGGALRGIHIRLLEIVLSTLRPFQASWWLSNEDARGDLSRSSHGNTRTGESALANVRLGRESLRDGP